MALIWDWDKKIGEIEVYDARANKDYILNLYEGNAMLIALYERIEGGMREYALHWYFADKEHARNCLGLNKGHVSIFDDGYLIALHLDNIAESRYWDKILEYFLKAYPKLKVTIN